MMVTKADGSTEEFDPEKIIATCMRAGTTREIAKKIARKVQESISEGTTTGEIYHLTIKELKKIGEKHAMLFRLREAIAAMDSESFELYTVRILEASGYKCRWNRIIQGKCIEHQVDIIARGSGTYLVECKKHTNPHRFCGLGVVLQVQARLEDLEDGYKGGMNKINFSQAWIFNNTRFSDHARIYGNAKNIRLTGWKTHDKFSLETMIERKKIYPVTILNSKACSLLGKRIITLQDFAKADKALLRKLLGKDMDAMMKKALKLMS